MKPTKRAGILKMQKMCLKVDSIFFLSTYILTAIKKQINLIQCSYVNKLSVDMCQVGHMCKQLQPSAQNCVIVVTFAIS